MKNIACLREMGFELERIEDRGGDVSLFFSSPALDIEIEKDKEIGGVYIKFRGFKKKVSPYQKKVRLRELYREISHKDADFEYSIEALDWVIYPRGKSEGIVEPLQYSIILPSTIFKVRVEKFIASLEDKKKSEKN